MIKIKIKKTLSEADVKHSKYAFEEMIKVIKKAQEENVSSLCSIIGIPLKDLIYAKNKNLLNGMVAFMHTTLKEKNISELKSKWNTEKSSFDDETINEYLNSNMPVIFCYAHDLRKSAPVNMVNITSYRDKDFILLQVSNSPVVYKSLRHELQHITQTVNGFFNNAYKQLIKNKKDISKYETIPIHVLPTDFGSGKTKTGFTNLDIKNLDLNNFDHALKYFSNDIEYKTAIKDFSEFYLDWLLDNGYFKVIKSLMGYDSKLTSREDKIKDTAVKLIKEIISNENRLASFSESTIGDYRFLNFVRVMDLVGKREYVKDLINSFTDEIKKFIGNQ
jgi:hypothetical protein